MWYIHDNSVSAFYENVSLSTFPHHHVIQPTEQPHPMGRIDGKILKKGWFIQLNTFSHLPHTPDGDASCTACDRVPQTVQLHKEHSP